VAADPLMTLSYTGVNGGLVIVSADDPGVHSSQNEQDNRFYGRFARVPVLEPSDSQECKDFVGVALDASEQLDTVALLRTTTRISHSKSLVEIGERTPRELLPYKKDVHKYVMIPGFAKLRQPEVLARFDRILAWSESTPINRIEWGDRKLGIITSGICYQYVKEARPDASVLKLGCSYPLPANLVREFALGVEHVAIVEELEPFLAEAVRLAGVDIVDLGLPRIGELSSTMVNRAIAKAMGEEVPPPPPFSPEQAPGRPPVLCPGCPHRGVFATLQKLRLVVCGDIGCYTLAVLPPLNALDMFMDMGASIGLAMGMEKADPESAKKTVSVIGDSTFLHSGMTGLLDMVYNGSHGTVLILDNSTTAMTGHQDHPATGKDAKGRPAPKASLEAICTALGVRRVRVFDALDIDGLELALKEETQTPEVSVIIARRPCVLITKQDGEPVEFNEDACLNCQMCMSPGCPAISWSEDDHPIINEGMCTSCGLCVSICPTGAITK
jgi:indolepyruvate ferredoxin oxidoreductase alpha subunit